MKKRLLTITAFVVSLGILNPLSCFAFERTDDEYGTIVANLESDSYGGAYIKDGVLHIKPLSEQIKPRLVKTSGNAQVVFDDIAQYSKEELNKAMEESVVLFDELDIDFVGIDEENNGLRVGMIDVTEEKKERFCHEIAIDNILFEEVSAIESPVENSNYAETDMGAERAADNEIQAGLDLFDDSKRRLECTNAASVYDSNNQFYFITTAHGMDVGDSMVYSRGEVGKISKSVLSPSR